MSSLAPRKETRETEMRMVGRGKREREQEQREEEKGKSPLWGGAAQLLGWKVQGEGQDMPGRD